MSQLYTEQAKFQTQFPLVVKKRSYSIHTPLKTIRSDLQDMFSQLH